MLSIKPLTLLVWSYLLCRISERHVYCHLSVTNVIELSLLTRFTVAQLLSKFPIFHGFIRFIPPLSSSQHWNIPFTSSVQSSERFISSNTYFNLILPPTPRFPRRLFPSGFTTEVLCALVFYPMRVTCPAHLTLLDLISLIIVRSISDS